tara:strand:- start:201 stop:809 length:609 start_codon:yes stop_codon:yes gene_type:complete
MFVGAIAAISQINFKRLLAYSSIGHVGYVLIGLASANEAGIKGVTVYMSIYLAMNIAIFTIILALKKENNFIERIHDFSGLSTYKPLLALSISIIMLSMAGIPPFAGFFGKFYIFTAALNADLYLLAILGVISSVISAFYYLRIIKFIYFDERNVSDSKLIFLISSKSLIVLLLSMTIITLFIFYPSLITLIGTEISRNYFN